MPILDYTCQKCKTSYDILVGMTSQDDPVQCPKCLATEEQSLIPSATGKPIIK